MATISLTDSTHKVANIELQEHVMRASPSRLREIGDQEGEH